MSSSFKTRYPDFASIEYQIRQAHAERSVAIATAIADGIIAAVRGIARLLASVPAARAVAAKAPVPRDTARV